MYSFQYVRPTSLADASDMLSADKDALLLAGGMSLLPMMKHRLVSASRLIDLARIDDMAGISAEGRVLTIKGMTRHADVAASEMVRSMIPALSDLAAGIGDRQVRYRGTIGGSVANNDPAADYPAALLALGARIRTTSRVIEADSFFTGMFETALQRGEIIAAIDFPVPARAAYVKFVHPASRFALVGVFVAQELSGQARVAVTGAGRCVFRVPEMEQALTAKFEPGAADAAIDLNGLNSDIHGDEEYRAHLIRVLAMRAVTKANNTGLK